MNTKTLLSRTIKVITRFKYSHVVLSLDDSYTKLYSFGRKKVYNFLNAGFVTYGLGSDFFKIYKNTECVIFELDVSLKSYNKLKSILKSYEKDAKKYRYDIKGLLIRYFYYNGKVRENYYVCSMFVASVLENADIYKFDKPVELVKPRDFLKIPNIKKIYEGKFNFSK